MSKNIKIEYIKGNIFNSERFELEMIVVFIPSGLTFLRHDSKDFIKKNSDFQESINGLKLYKSKKQQNKYLQYIMLDENIKNEIYCEIRLRTIIDNVLSIASNLGIKSLGMNGIRIDSYSFGNRGYQERILSQFVSIWLNYNKKSCVEKVVFIDKRGGFNILNNC